MANKSTTGQKHPYHLVDPSPLPFLSSIAGLAMAAGLVFYMNYGTSWYNWLVNYYVFVVERRN